MAGILKGRARVLAGVDLGGLTASLAEAYGDHPALVVTEPTPGLAAREVRSFADLEEDVARLAAAHHELGHGDGARVALVIENRIDIVLHVLALARVGAVPVPLNPRLKEAELRGVLQEARAKVIVADAPEGELVEAVDGLEGVRWCWTGHREHDRTGADLRQWLESHPDARRTEAAERDGEGGPELLLATSGTTGRPKLARLGSEGLLGVLRYAALVPLGQVRGPRAGRDALLCALPLVHVMGLSTVLGGLCAGIRTIHLPRFDAGTVLDRIETDRPNVYVGVPTMYADLERAGAAERDLSSVQLWVSAADVLPADRARRFQGFGAMSTAFGRRVGTAAFADVYGMVELSGPAAVRLYPPSPVAGARVPPIALMFPGFEARVVSEEGDPVRVGTAGQLQVRGRGVLSGYEGDQEALDDEGWFGTGDLARLWPGGVLTFVGRTRDRLKVGGFSVFPAEVEETLRGRPDVKDVVLVGLPDDRLGERPVALVIPAAESFDPDDFLAWAHEHVAGYRRPREAVAVEELPRGKHGKVDRAAATELACERLGFAQSS